MNYVVAVSGGVDSVVLLDMLMNKLLSQKKDNPLTDEIKCNDSLDGLVVAHFDHGIREESADDAVFVRGLAEKYGLPFETRREELGPDASEELARDRRYAFLREIAKKHNAKIMTAHHADDVIETIAINLTRGTGWRGLAVLDSHDIERPLLDRSKSELIGYARQHELQWREDSTNQDTKYLRNELRQKLAKLDDQTHQLLKLYRERQIVLKREIGEETGRLIGEAPYARYLFINAPEAAALELLRAVFVREIGYNPTRPQCERALLAVKVLHAGKRFEVADGITLQFTKSHFVVELKVKVVS